MFELRLFVLRRVVPCLHGRYRTGDFTCQ
jgi:hypothetical protein